MNTRLGNHKIKKIVKKRSKLVMRCVRVAGVMVGDGFDTPVETRSHHLDGRLPGGATGGVTLPLPP